MEEKCSQCCTLSILICVTCNRHFCWKHFNEHRESYEKYLDDRTQPLSNCLNEFNEIENQLRSDIDQWENETINKVKKSAKHARRVLDVYISGFWTHFNEETFKFREILSLTNRDKLLHRLEKLQIEYGQSLNDLYLVKHHDRDLILDIETKEKIITNQLPQESDDYIAQTSLGQRLIKDPLTTISVGNYWAMSGSNQYLLLQEYENNQLTLFDSHGIRDLSMTWHFDLVVRDIIWNDELQRFFLLLDKQFILFDPITKHIQEINQIKPYQLKTYRRCTSSNDHLFIVYWGQESLIELIQISTWESKQCWFSPVTCHTNELIACIRFNSNNQLALSIQDENNPLCRKFRFEIRDIALNILHTLPLCVDSGIFSRMTALPDLHWALLNVDENYVFVVNQYGELIDKIQWPHGPLANIALIGEDRIVIRTKDKIYFYDVNFHKKHQT